MEIARPDFVPDPSLSRAEMEELQRAIADAATFSDGLDFDPSAVTVDGDTAQQRLGGESPLVAGVDQAFRNGSAVSAVVVLRDGEVVERVHAVEPVEIPYIPGLLSFREGAAILAALAALDSDPDVLLVDGSGRIHFREAGLATHIGVAVDVPAIGVAKSLLCGRPRDSLAAPLPEGSHVAIVADEDVTAADGTVIGYAVQTRQYDSGNRHINPLYVSPGHRVSAETAAEIAERAVGAYKLPEPTRLADDYADECKRRC
jgi:deoxyribonuclease V